MEFGRLAGPRRERTSVPFGTGTSCRLSRRRWSLSFANLGVSRG